MSNHYRTLGVDPQAEAVVIRSAYLALIRRYHPDKGGEEADPARAQAVTAAWEVLGDPERRATYDQARRARLEPHGGGLAAFADGPRVRGGAAARNLFLLLAAGTLALGWWATNQSLGISPVATNTKAGKSVPPPPDAVVAEAEPIAEPEPAELSVRQPRLPDVREEPDIAPEVELPPLPEAEAAPMPLRVTEPRTAARRPTPSDETRPPSRAPRPSSGVETAAPAPGAKTPVPTIDLAPLERHLQLLTDQSLRFGTEAKRSRLFTTREAFLKRLRECDTDTCKRDAYLRRNAEIGDIMRN